MIMLELWHEWKSVQSFKVRVVLAEKNVVRTEHRIELLNVRPPPTTVSISQSERRGANTRP
jgi:hypothetical protein